MPRLGRRSSKSAPPPGVERRDQQHGHEGQPERPVEGRLQEGQGEEVEGDVHPEDGLGLPGGSAVQEEEQLLPEAVGAEGDDQGDQEGGYHPDQAGGAAQEAAPDAHRPEHRAGAEAKSDQDVGSDVDEGDQQAAEEEPELEAETGRVDLLDAERLEPEQAGRDRDRRPGDGEDDDEHPDGAEHEPGASRRRGQAQGSDLDVVVERRVPPHPLSPLGFSVRITARAATSSTIAPAIAGR